jgi:hypothetical protein
MSYDLVTENAGKQDSGFISGHMAEIAIGDYWVKPEDFCRLYESLAAGSRTGLILLSDYTPNTQAAGPDAFDTRASLIPNLPEGDKDLVEVEFDALKGKIKFGSYEVAAKEFAYFSSYIFGGGLFGWGADENGISRRPAEISQSLENILRDALLKQCHK